MPRLGRIALLLDEGWETAPRVEWLLVDAGFEVEVNPGWNRLDGFDLCWLRANHWEPDRRHLMAKALVLDAQGVSFVNPISAVLRCADKLASGEALARAGVRVPRPWTASEPIGSEGGWIVKPRVGSGQRAIEVCAKHHQVQAYLASCATDQVAQERIVGRNWRVIATPEIAVRTYTMPVDGRGVTLLPEGEKREIVEQPATSLEAAATEAVRILGGTLLGVDLIEDEEGEYWVLEGNAGFGFNPGDSEVELAILDAVIGLGDARARSVDVSTTGSSPASASAAPSP